MRNQIKVSVVIPLYNKELSIVRAIESILNQTYRNYEVLIINDGSTDRSVENVKPFLNDTIRLIDKPNGGVSSARNLGIEEAKYDYIAFLDADDCWENHFLETIVKLIEKTKEAALWGGRQKIIYSNQNVGYSSKSTLKFEYEGYVDDYWTIALNGLLYHSSCIVVSKTSINYNHIRFNERLLKGEDLDFYFRIALHCKVAYIDKVISSYHLDAENRAMNKYCPIEKRLVGNINMYEKYLLENSKFCSFISKYLLTCIGLLLNEGANDFDIMLLEKYIDFHKLSFRMKLYYLLPNLLKKNIYSYLKCKL